MTALRLLDNLVRIAGTLALLLGLALWGGWFYGLLTLHMALGLAAVVGLWGLAGLALRRGVLMGLAVGAILLGVLVLAIGGGQTRLMVGDWHWVIQGLHLILGVAGIGLGAVLAGRLRRAGA